MEYVAPAIAPKRSIRCFNHELVQLTVFGCDEIVFHSLKAI